MSHNAITAAIIDEAEEAGRAAVLEMISGGLSGEEALAIVGQALEALAIPAFSAIVHGLQADPDRLDKRAEDAAQRGHFLVAARRRARAERLRASRTVK